MNEEKEIIVPQNVNVKNFGVQEVIIKSTTNLLPKPSEEEIGFTMSYTEMDHLRDICRIFKNKVGITEGGSPVLLDLGCRDSKIRPFFKNLGYEWTGVDADPTTSDVVVGSMENIPFKNESFNVVFCSHAFEHTLNPLKALQEMNRVVRAGGMIFIATPAYDKNQIFNCDKTHNFIFTDLQMRRLFQLAKIKPVLIENWNVEGQGNMFGSLISIGISEQ